MVFASLFLQKQTITAVRKEVISFSVPGKFDFSVLQQITCILALRSALSNEMKSHVSCSIISKLMDHTEWQSIFCKI